MGGGGGFIAWNMQPATPKRQTATITATMGQARMDVEANSDTELLNGFFIFMRWERTMHGIGLSE